MPEIFEAIDGSKVPMPHNWQDGAGAWGCMQSHRHVLERAILDGVDSLLILEDDAIIRPTFAQDVKCFLADVPPDWDGLMLGGQSFDNRPCLPGILRCFNCQRTHAYAVRGAYLRDLYQHWISTSGHCDHRMGEIQHRYRVYAPEPFLVGQTEGESDIGVASRAENFWIAPKDGAPVILLHAPKDLLPDLREAGFHMGHNRDPRSDIDVGLRDIFFKPDGHRRALMSEWISMIQYEVANMDQAVCTVWHPQATMELLREATFAPAIEIHATTVIDALKQLPSDLPLAPPQPPRDSIMLLHGPKYLAQQLRECGFHSGFTRHPQSDFDQSLLKILEEPRLEKKFQRLKEWLEQLAREAKAIHGSVLVWHPDVTIEMLKAATDRGIVELVATNIREALRQWHGAQQI
jgi:hypothetical protein